MPPALPRAGAKKCAANPLASLKITPNHIKSDAYDLSGIVDFSPPVDYNFRLFLRLSGPPGGDRSYHLNTPRVRDGLESVL